jgi:membrane associated rhomboid family serine protease
MTNSWLNVLRYAALPCLFLLLFVLQQQVPEIHKVGALWSDHPRWWQFFTCNFLSGSWIHLGVNVLSVGLLHFWCGPRVRLWAMLMLFAFFSSLASGIYFLFFMPQHAWLVGASGGLYSLLGFFGWFQRRTKLSWMGIRALSLPFLVMLLLAIGLEALIAHLWIPRLAWPMHAVGMVAGFIAALGVQAVFGRKLPAFQKMIYILELREPVSVME